MLQHRTMRSQPTTFAARKLCGKVSLLRGELPGSPRPRPRARPLRPPHRPPHAPSHQRHTARAGADGWAGLGVGGLTSGADVLWVGLGGGRKGPELARREKRGRSTHSGDQRSRGASSTCCPLRATKAERTSRCLQLRVVKEKTLGECVHVTGERRGNKPPLLVHAEDLIVSLRTVGRSSCRSPT